MNNLVLPVLEKLNICSLDTSAKNYVQMLIENIKQITLPIEQGLNALKSKLSPKEYEVSLMIRNGLSSKEIAQSLSLSPETIKWHRNNIREKLSIKDTKTSLTQYLRSWED